MIRKLIALAGCAGVLLVSGCSSQSSSQVSASLGAKSLPAISPPPYVPGPFDGLSTRRALAVRRPLGVIIENYAPDSRPQAGLSQASTVIETLAEGGVTRFMAIYLEKDARKVGPVRSTRMYFDRWATAFHTILAHVGGNDDALNYLWHAPKVFNIDENRWEISLTNTGTPLFWRSQDRVAPHNMYVSTYMLRRYAARNKQNWAYSGAYLLHKKPLALPKRGRSQSIQIGFEDPLNPVAQPDYAVQYTYNRSTNSYARSMGGAPHVDAATGKRLQPANVIVMQTGQATFDPNAGPTAGSILIPTIGKGAAFYFRDGRVEKGYWQQKNDNAPLRFYRKNGQQAAFNPGQTWIEVVPPSSPWSYR